MDVEKLIEMTEKILVLRGSGRSGNYGHVGRPGKLGGSSLGGGHGKIGVGPKDSPRKVKQKAKGHKDAEKRFRKGVRLFNKVKNGGQLKLTDGELDIDISIKTFAGALGLAVKKPGNKKFGKHFIRSSTDIKNYLGQFQERKKK